MTVSAISSALTGLAAARQQVEQVAGTLARNGTADPAQADAANLSEEIVKLLVAQRAFETNVKVARTALEVERSALDILA